MESVTVGDLLKYLEGIPEDTVVQIEGYFDDHPTPLCNVLVTQSFSHKSPKPKQTKVVLKP